MKELDHITDSRFDELADHISNKCDPQWKDELLCCVPLLFELVNESQGRSLDQLEVSIRCIVNEHCHVDIAGDAPVHDDVALEHHVKIVMGAMEKFYRTQCRWSESPVTPQMFG